MSTYVKETCQYPSYFMSPSTFPFSSTGAQAWQSREAHFCDFSPLSAKNVRSNTCLVYVKKKIYIF